MALKVTNYVFPVFQKCCWMTSWWPTRCSCPPMTSVRLCWDNILTSKDTHIITHTHTKILSASTLFFFVSLTRSFTYSSARCRVQEEGKDALFRKRKVLQLVSHWSRLYKDFLKEEEHIRSFMKVRHDSPSSPPFVLFLFSQSVFYLKDLMSLILWCPLTCH